MPLFNIRVYGILLDSQQRLLVSDEFIRGAYITKLPGGGLEFGEGTRDCLKREFKEETGLDVVIGDHFYTTDFFKSLLSTNAIRLFPSITWCTLMNPFHSKQKQILSTLVPNKPAIPMARAKSSAGYRGMN